MWRTCCGDERCRLVCLVQVNSFAVSKGATLSAADMKILQQRIGAINIRNRSNAKAGTCEHRCCVPSWPKQHFAILSTSFAAVSWSGSFPDVMTVSLHTQLDCHRWLVPLVAMRRLVAVIFLQRRPSPHLDPNDPLAQPPLLCASQAAAAALAPAHRQPGHPRPATPRPPHQPSPRSTLTP